MLSKHTPFTPPLVKTKADNNCDNDAKKYHAVGLQFSNINLLQTKSDE
jgi:hypothetical protein